MQEVARTPHQLGVTGVLLFFIALSLLNVTRSNTQPGSAKKRPLGPADVVRKFCRLDFDGAREDALTMGRLRPYVTWEEIPATDTAIVISAFQITSEKQEGDSATVTVQYDVLGTLGGVEEWHPERKSEVIQFQLVRIKNKWKIDGTNPYGRPVMLPHISLRRARQDVREQLEAVNKSKDPFSLSLKPDMENVLRQLDALWQQEQHRHQR